ncbi:MAG: hypothetical protein RBS96_07230 [Dehalococcoidales bacterium]|jgi:hypothetical protein|nr:hypothetical protein [Dehalococcoidales bacterium]
MNQVTVQILPKIEEKFYYYTQLGKDFKAYTITQCVLHVKGEPLAYGFAFCSSKDSPNKKKGRLIARGRARKALITKQSYGILPEKLKWGCFECASITPLDYRGRFIKSFREALKR